MEAKIRWQFECCPNIMLYWCHNKCIPLEERPQCMWLQSMNKSCTNTVCCMGNIYKAGIHGLMVYGVYLGPPNDDRTARNFQQRAALELEPINTPSMPLYVAFHEVQDCAMVLLSFTHRLGRLVEVRGGIYALWHKKTRGFLSHNASCVGCIKLREAEQRH